MKLLPIKFDPWTDPECQSAFCQLNQEDFLEWATEKAKVKDNYPDLELDFCEDRTKQFLNFADRYAEALLEEEADRNNDERKSHQD